MSEEHRPQSFDEYVGQRPTIDVLRRAVAAAKVGRRACGHVLLCGGAGLGKTSLANLISTEMGTRLHVVVCRAISHKGELTGMLTQLGRGDVLFLDEIHGLDKKLQELLYTSAEDGVVDLPAARRVIRIRLQPFTLVGATTRAHLLTGPLRDRFQYQFNLTRYTAEELSTIAARAAVKLRLPMDAGAADDVGRRSRGTPRVAIRLVRACRDFMQSAGLQRVTAEVADATCEALGVDRLGLTEQDRDYLRVLADRGFAPVGVNAIATQLGVEVGVVQMFEAHLVETGLVLRTEKGRVCTPDAVAHLHRWEAEQVHQLDERDLVPEELS